MQSQNLEGRVRRAGIVSSRLALATKREKQEKRELKAGRQEIAPNRLAGSENPALSKSRHLRPGGMTHAFTPSAGEAAAAASL